MANEFIVRKGLIVEGASGGTVVDIQGSQGQLFSVTDDLSGSIFAVSDISGVPIFDVNSSGVSYFDGNVGISVAAPSKKLEVAGSYKLGTNSYIEYGGVYPYTISTLNTAAVGNLIFTAGSGSSGYESGITLQGSNTAGDDAITFTAGSSTAMVIQVNGNVGIGTTSSVAKLDVDYDATLTYDVAANQPVAIVANRNNSNVNNQVATLGLHATGWQGTTTGVINLNAIQTNGNASTADFSIQTRNGGTFAEKFRIKAAGNVGIGTASPDALLDIEAALNPTIRLTNSTNPLGAADVGTLEFFTKDTSADAARVISSIVCVNEADSPSVPDGQLVFKTSLGGANAQPATEKMRIDAAGNVGIGLNAPTATLTIKGTSNNGIAVQGVATTANRVFAGLNSSNHGYLFATGSSGQSPSLINSAGGNSYISGGNVGIGTTSPDYKLDVENLSGESWIRANSATSSDVGYRFARNGVNKWVIYNQGSSDAFEIYQNSATASRLRIDSSGNVGIGITPYGHGTGFLGLDLGGTTSSNIGGRSRTRITSNVYYDGTNNIYKEAYGALGYYQDAVNVSHAWYTAPTGAAGGTVTLAERMRIDSAGAVKFNAYGAGYLQTDANGNITAGTVTTSDTLDDVTDNGNSTTNSIVLGASTVDGTMLVRGTYSSGNIVVIGGMKSSGGAMIGYAVKPDTSTNHGFVSSSAFTLERAAYYQQGNRHRWYAGASQNAAIGNAVTMSETMRLDSDKLGLSTSSPASLIHLGKSTNGSNIITFGEAGIGGPHGLDFYGDDATRTLKYSIYYRTNTENISMETSNGTKRFEINQSGAVTFNEAFTFPTADGGAGSALITDGSGALSWNAGYKQYSPVGWQVLNNQTKTASAQNISSNSSQVLNGTTPVQRNSATEFQATKQGWYEIQYSFIIKNNYTNRALVGAYMGYAHGSGGGVISGSHSTDYVRYNTYGEYAQVQNTYYFYAPDGVTKFYLFSYLLSGSMNMTTQALTQSMISFRYINNDIT
jgi:hypothetical protein